MHRFNINTRIRFNVQAPVKKNGEVKINDNGLVALALLVAQSDPAEKELMIRLVINLINNR